MLPKLTDPPQVTVEAAAKHLSSLGNLVSEVSLVAPHRFTSDSTSSSSQDQSAGSLNSPSAADTTFGDIAYDSRKVTANSAFVCLPGEKTDGNKFIKDALALGASVIFTESSEEHSQQEDQAKFARVQVKDARQALAQVADFLYDSPSSKVRLLGVTGTNGKTTTTHLVEHIFAQTGKKIGLIGTLGARTNVDSQGGYTDMKHTTPQASDLQKLFFDMHKAGVGYVAMEVSSHALALKRVAACEFAAICLTNLTQDHLDFHKDMENYFESKRLLFEMLNEGNQPGRTAVVNKDDAWGKRFIDSVKPGVKLITYGWNSDCDLYVKSADFDFSGTDLILDGIFGIVKLKLQLNGKFNVYNVMAAILLCTSEGISIEQCVVALENFAGVSGRFESVSASASERDQAARQPLCLVDYAHTPDGLENVLKSARALVPPEGRLIAVFGCGGDRDATKRPQMGKIAETLADLVIVTSDNPRSEEPDLIIQNIMAGIVKRENVKVKADRTEAINLAVESATDNDVVVVAGKGHETYQILRDKTIDFDDRLVVRTALNKRLSR